MIINSLSIIDVISKAVEFNASDVHISPGKPIIFRIDGDIVKISDYIVSSSDTQAFIEEYLSKEIRDKFFARHSYDISIQTSESRARIHLYETIDGICMSIRLIPIEPKSMNELKIPPIIKEWMLKKGIIIISGLTNTGKTTTLASMVKHVNETKSNKIVILEDPVEYIHQDQLSSIYQREVGMHSPSYHDALSDVAREDADIVVVGEVRHMNAMDAVFTMAEAGLSVYTSIHANSALETIERIVNMFPPSDYERIYNRLSWTLIGIINQRLFKKRGGGRVLVCEILTNTEAVKNMIRAGKIQGIKNLFDTTYTGEIVSYEKYIENLKTSGVL